MVERTSVDITLSIKDQLMISANCNTVLRSIAFNKQS